VLSAHGATLIGPALPIRIGALHPGTFATISLTLECSPQCEGSATDGRRNCESRGWFGFKFSLGQVIRSKKHK